MRTAPSRLAVATLAGLLVLSGSGSHASGRAAAAPVRVEVTASAHPHHAGLLDLPTVDRGFGVDAADRTSTRAVTTATASAVCSGCSGQASSVHVLYLDRPPAIALDNVAVAWDQGCRRCHAAAVSVQVAVVSDPGSLTTANRAMAVNASCRHCTARSAAYQVVVAGDPQARFTPTALARLRDWASAQAHLLAQPSTSARWRASAVQQQAGTDLERLVNTDLGTRTVVTHVRVSGR